VGRVVRGEDDIKAEVVLPEAGFPLFFLNEVVRQSVGFLFCASEVVFADDDFVLVFFFNSK